MAEISTERPSLDQDILCIGCGYNLRGLSEPGRCPECGLEIGNSLRGDLLAGADGGWLQKLRLGVTLKLWNIVIAIFGSFIIGLLFAAVGAPPMLLAVLPAVGGILGLLGTFYITSQEPRMILTEAAVTLRRLIRTCALIATIGGLPQHLVDSATVQNIPLLDSELFWILFGLVIGLAGIVVFFGELKYLRTFALRAPDLKLAKSTRVLMWVLGIGMMVVIVGGGILAILFGGTAGTTFTAGTNPGGAGIAIVGCVGIFIAAVLFLWYVSLLTRYRRMFIRAITESAARGGLAPALG